MGELMASLEGLQVSDSDGLDVAVVELHDHFIRVRVVDRLHGASLTIAGVVLVCDFDGLPD